MRKSLIRFILVSSLLLGVVGCGAKNPDSTAGKNSTVEENSNGTLISKALEQGKLAVASNQLDAAENSFNLILNDDSEHAIIYNAKFRNEVSIGDKVQIIPNHICPVCNLHEKAYLISGDEVLEELLVECKGKLQ